MGLGEGRDVTPLRPPGSKRPDRALSVRRGLSGCHTLAIVWKLNSNFRAFEFPFYNLSEFVRNEHIPVKELLQCLLCV